MVAFQWDRIDGDQENGIAPFLEKSKRLDVIIVQLATDEHQLRVGGEQSRRNSPKLFEGEFVRESGMAEGVLDTVILRAANAREDPIDGISIDEKSGTVPLDAEAV